MDAPGDSGEEDRGGADATPRGGATWRLDVAYEGTAYRGWARQPGQPSIEGLLGEALATVLRERVRLSVAGRTDAGVHAWAQVASFHSVRSDLLPERVRLSLNALLPPDIAVTAVAAAPPGFVARRARTRTYQYRLWLSPAKPVRERAFVWSVRGAVDVGLLKRAASLLPGRLDCAALTPSAHLYHHCVREVLEATWRVAAHDEGPAAGGRFADAALAEPAAGPEWVFTITAGSFLHHMVRVAVGSMVDVAQGRMTVEQFAEALAAGERARMGQTAPSRGLALVRVTY